MKPTIAQLQGNKDIPYHTHNGSDSPKILQSNIVPTLRASGSISMATTDTRYTLGLPFNPTMVQFYGSVTHSTGGNIDYRAFVYGTACLGPSYYFQPQSGTSVTVGGPLLNVIQSTSSLLTAESALTDFRALSSEGHLVRVVDPAGTVVASATIPNLSTQEAWSDLTDKGYGAGYVFVDVTLEADWEINGNFVVT